MSQTCQGSVGSTESGSGKRAAGPDLDWMAAAVAENPCSPLFPVLTETYRQMGELDEARRVAEAGLAQVPDNAAGRVALALTLLDLGEVGGAHQQLAGALASLQAGSSRGPRPGPADALAPAAPLGEDSGRQPLFAGETAGTESFSPPSTGLDAGLEDAEIDLAFESAEAQADEMIDANVVVEQALRREDLDAPEGDFSPLASSPTYATRTVAELLECQGDEAGAQAIRSSLGSRAREEVDAAQVPEAPEHGVPGGGGWDRDSAERARILSILETWLLNIRRGVA